MDFIMVTKENYCQYFKYSIYFLLTLNFYFFFTEDLAAFSVRYSDAISLNELITAYSASIDTIAWLILLWILELETYILDDNYNNKLIDALSVILKALCYVLIIYSFFGYSANLLFFYKISPVDISNLCMVTHEQWMYSYTINEYVPITAQNCTSLSTANEFFRYENTRALVDLQGYEKIIWLGWIDVVNAGVWILVVIIIEFNVHLQEKQTGKALSIKLSAINKYALYPILFFNAFYWGLEGDFVDFWDAFLWLVAFLFIELNIIEWRDEIPAMTE